MARMSIDDKFLRDPRITQLAMDLHMSRWEAMGRLLAVFAVCYDLERDTLTCNQVDLAAERPGFGDAMFASDLAVNVRRGMRIRGAGKRIEYLAPKRAAGRLGGLKSAESRRLAAKQRRTSAGGAASNAITDADQNAEATTHGPAKQNSTNDHNDAKPHGNQLKQNRENREARLNPPDPVPDLLPDPVPEDQDLPPARDRAVPALPPQPPPPQPAPPPVLPASIARAETRRRVIATAWQLGARDAGR